MNRVGRCVAACVVFVSLTASMTGARSAWADLPSRVEVADTQKVGDVAWPLGGEQARLDVHTLVLEQGIPARRLLRVDLHGAGHDVDTVLLDIAQARRVSEEIAGLIDRARGGDARGAANAGAMREVEGVGLGLGAEDALLLRLPGQGEPVRMPLPIARRAVALFDQGIARLR
jgi:hypothetical protein